MMKFQLRQRENEEHKYKLEHYEYLKNLRNNLIKEDALLVNNVNDLKQKIIELVKHGEYDEELLDGYLDNIAKLSNRTSDQDKEDALLVNTNVNDLKQKIIQLLKHKEYDEELLKEYLETIAKLSNRNSDQNNENTEFKKLSNNQQSDDKKQAEMIKKQA